MRQQKALAVVVVSLIALSLLPVQAVSAQAAFIPCGGTLTFSQPMESGTYTYPDGNIHARGMVNVYDQEMSDERCTGWNTVTANANWDAYGVGPSWGKFHVDSKDGSSVNGGWDGTWTGMTYPDGSSSIQVVGHGYGDLEGMKVFVDIEFPAGYGWGFGVASGYILDPHGQ